MQMEEILSEIEAILTSHLRHSWETGLIQNIQKIKTLAEDHKFANPNTKLRQYSIIWLKNPSH